jgi:peptide/nickel transport system substrate-binding protein
MTGPRKRGRRFVTSRRILATGSLVVVLALVAAACGGNGTTTTPTDSGSGGITKGGTYRTATQEFGYTDAFDPTGEYLGNAWGLYGQLLVRGLMTYNHKNGESGGDNPIPDLATDPPEISVDGLTYTFKLRDNVMFGPPVDRVVTSHDVEYAFERINLASLAAQYGNYYCGVIQGMTCSEKELGPVSGISTPDDTTITFTLEQPTGDFLYRLSMPATAAVPQEVAKCFLKAGDYGRFVISSGAYMIQGEEALDLSQPCSTLAKNPISGYNPDKGVTFVRNPNYDPASEQTESRGNYLDGIQIAINSNVDDIFAKIASNDLDGSYGDTPPATVEQQYATNPDLKANLHSDESDRTWYFTMTLLAPPFDDIHVRRAVNFVMDKAALAKAYGGPLHAVPATSIEPPSVNAATADYNPYPSTDFAGDEAAAMEEMKQSKYDTNQDGKCDAPECEGFLFLGRSSSPWPNLNQVAMDSFAKIGLLPKLSEVDTTTGYTTLQSVKKLIPISLVPGWGKDFASPFGFNYFLFDSRAGLSCDTAVDYSLVGMTAEKAKECGVEAEYNRVTSEFGPIGSVDAKMDECVTKSAEEIDACFAEMDKALMEDIVPWIPWGWANNIVITGTTTTNYEYDANGGVISLCWVAVDNGLAPQGVA